MGDNLEGGNITKVAGLNYSIIHPSIYHRSIDGLVLAMAREAAGLTQEQLGVKAAEIMKRDKPVSRQFIQRLERHGIWEIRTEMAVAIEKVLQEI